MYSNEKHFNIKEQLTAATDTVRRKFNAFKSGRVLEGQTLERLYEPLTKPLNVLSKSAQNPIVTKQEPIKEEYVREEKIVKPKKLFDESFNDSVMEEDEFRTPDTISNKLIGNSLPISAHIRRLATRGKEYDRQFGINMDPKTNTPKMGKLDVQLSDKSIIFSKNGENIAEFEGNPELYGLVLYKTPPTASEENMKTYKEILNITGSPFKGFDRSKGFNKSKSKKLNTLIKPLLSKTGVGLKGIKPYKIISKCKPEYVYWNKPAELVSRLRLLWSSKQAGHTGHDNEVLSIIEELREEGIIY